MVKQRRTMLRRAVPIALLLTAASTTAQVQQTLSPEEVLARCLPITEIQIRLPEREGSCVRVLAMHSASMDLQYVLDLLAAGRVGPQVYGVDPRRFSTDIKQFSIDISPDRYFLVEGIRQTPSNAHGAHVAEARVSSLTWEQLRELAGTRFAWGPVREKALKLPGNADDLAERHALFPDQPALRRLLSLLLDEPENYWDARNALELFHERNPTLTAKYARQIRAALDVALMAHEGVETMSRKTDCALFDDCRAFAAFAHRRWDRADGDLDSPDDKPWIEREWPRLRDRVAGETTTLGRA